ncbi:hypothetical protein evm_001847 [Chilo suppressalis]|nr:hypothetical protein evm_001847 [Chilo suppressalis]
MCIFYRKQKLWLSGGKFINYLYIGFFFYTGYKLNDSKVHREEHSKWHLPHWLFPRDVIPEYLSGTSYILQGDYIDKILEASYKTTMINLEDVYFTYLVSRSALRLSLSHDRRLSPYKPWITADCAFWGLASVHSVTPMEIMGAWEKIESLAWRIERGEEVCTYMRYFSSDIFLY